MMLGCAKALHIKETRACETNRPQVPVTTRSQDDATLDRYYRAVNARALIDELVCQEPDAIGPRTSAPYGIPVRLCGGIECDLFLTSQQEAAQADSLADVTAGSGRDLLYSQS